MKDWYVTIAMAGWVVVGVTTRFLTRLPGLAPASDPATLPPIPMVAWAAIWAGLMGYGRFRQPGPYKAAGAVLSFIVFFVPLAAMVAYPRWESVFGAAWIVAFVAWLVVGGASIWRRWPPRGTVR